MGSVQYVENIFVEKCVEWNFWQIAPKCFMLNLFEFQFVKNLWLVQFVETSFLTTLMLFSRRAMTDSTKVNGRAKVCERSEHRATLRPRGRHCFPLVVTFSTNHEIFVRSVENLLFCWQIVIWHIASRHIVTHPKWLLGKVDKKRTPTEKCSKRFLFLFVAAFTKLILNYFSVSLRCK